MHNFNSARIEDFDKTSTLERAQARQRKSGLKGRFVDLVEPDPRAGRRRPVHDPPSNPGVLGVHSIEDRRVSGLQERVYSSSMPAPCESGPKPNRV
ncbi:MAG: hypothetical protein OXI93_18010 [Bryobacterales bacterium]|nr:hypothetical protein [Bryobacterales bacterium]